MSSTRCATHVIGDPDHRDEPTCRARTAGGEHPSASAFTFEHAGTGTRIHVTQSGFDPAFVEMAGEDFWTHGTFLLDEVERFFLGDASLETS